MRTPAIYCFARGRMPYQIRDYPEKNVSSTIAPARYLDDIQNQTETLRVLPKGGTYSNAVTLKPSLL